MQTLLTMGLICVLALLRAVSLGQDVNLLSASFLIWKVGRRIQCLRPRVIVRIKGDGEMVADLQQALVHVRARSLSLQNLKNACKVSGALLVYRERRG